MVKMDLRVASSEGQWRWMGLCNGRQSHTWMAAGEAAQIWYKEMAADDHCIFRWSPPDDEWLCLMIWAFGVFPSSAKWELRLGRAIAFTRHSLTTTGFVPKTGLHYLPYETIARKCAGRKWSTANQLSLHSNRHCLVIFEQNLPSVTSRSVIESSFKQTNLPGGARMSECGSSLLEFEQSLIKKVAPKNCEHGQTVANDFSTRADNLNVSARHKHLVRDRSGNKAVKNKHNSLQPKSQGSVSVNPFQIMQSVRAIKF